MAIEARLKKTTIDGEAYELGLLNAETALEVWHRIAVVALPALRQAHLSGDETVAAMAGLETVFRSWSPGDRADVVEPLLGVVIHGGQRLSDTWGVHFSGRLLHLYRVLAAVTQHNFADFFAEVDELAALVRRPATPPADPATPDTSTV